MSEQVNAFAKNSITQFGLSEKMAKQYMGTFGAMSKSFGFTEESAYEMSKTMTGLVGDVASFYNISQDLAAIKLKAVWTGETEGLKDLGVVMTQTALEEYAFQKGMGKTISQMSEAEKVALRYSFVQDKLSGAMGDFTRTSDGWANQTRVLSLRFEQLKATLGQGFITLFTPIIKGINVILGGLQKLAEVFSTVIGKIFGKQSEVISNVSADYVGVGESAMDSANKVVSASKKAQKAVMGYDKLNILSNKNDSGNSDSGGTPNIGGTTISTPKIEDNTSSGLDAISAKISKKIQDFIEPLRNISFKPLINSLRKLKNAFTPFAKSIFKGLEWGYFNLLVPLAKFTIEDVIPTFFDLLSGALKILNPILTAFGNIFSPIWENLLKPLASWTGGIVIDILKGIAEILNSLGEWMSEHQTIIEDFIIIIGSFAVAWGLVNFALNAWNIAVGIWNGLGIVATTVTTGFGAAMTLLTSPVALVTLAIGSLIMIVSLLIKHWDDVKAAAGACWEWIVGVWNVASEWFNTTIIQPISNFFSSMWNGLKNGASNAWEGIKSVFSKAGEFFGNIFGNAWQRVKEIFSTGGRIFDGIKEGIVSSFKNIVNAIIRGINRVVSIPFNGINNALGRIRGIDILGYKPFDWIPTINTPQIPELAQGGWFQARNPQLAIVGEGKHNEIVAPEPKLDEAIDRGFHRNGNLATNNKLEITIIHKYPNGEMMIDEINDAQVKAGKILLNV